MAKKDKNTLVFELTLVKEVDEDRIEGTFVAYPKPVKKDKKSKKK